MLFPAPLEINENQTKSQVLFVGFKKHEMICHWRSDRALTFKRVLLRRVRSHLLVQQVGAEPEWRQSFKQTAGRDASGTATVCCNFCLLPHLNIARKDV